MAFRNMLLCLFYVVKIKGQDCFSGESNRNIEEPKPVDGGSFSFLTMCSESPNDLLIIIPSSNNSYQVPEPIPMLPGVDVHISIWWPAHGRERTIINLKGSKANFYLNDTGDVNLVIIGRAEFCKDFLPWQKECVYKEDAEIVEKVPTNSSETHTGTSLIIILVSSIACVVLLLCCCIFTVVFVRKRKHIKKSERSPSNASTWTTVPGVNVKFSVAGTPTIKI